MTPPETAQPTPKTRLFTDGPLGPGLEIRADEADAHHVVRVLRLGPGDSLSVFNGRDGEWAATITDAGKKSLTLRLDRQTRPQTPEPDIWLLFAPLKKTATDFIVEKATELGVARLIPVLTERTETRRVNLDRLAQTARDAACQCERLGLPAIEQPRPLADVLAAWPEDRTLVAALERARDVPPLSSVARETPLPHAFLIGPEGGFSPAELDGPLKQAFVRGAHLGPRILRAETAALAALSLWQDAAGDINTPKKDHT